METVETTQNQRSEEWTEHEKELAERYKVEPKLVRLLTELAQEERARGPADILNEQKIAEKYNVPIERVRTVSNLCADLAKRILQADARGERESETEAAVEDVSMVQPPGEVEVVEDPGPESRTQAVVKRWLLERDYSTKLACILFSEYNVMDHNTEQLSDEVRGQYESDILAVAEDPEKQPNGISVKEIFLSGVVAESLLTNQLR